MNISEQQGQVSEKRANYYRNQTLALPAPISTNNLYRNVPGRGRVPTPEYKAWKEEAALRLMAQRARPMLPPYCIVLTIPAKWRGDLDNAAKAPLDALQSACVLRNDRDVADLRIIRAGGGPGIKVVVMSLVRGAVPVPHEGSVA